MINYLKYLFIFLSIFICSSLIGITLADYPLPFSPDPCRFEDSIDAFSAQDATSMPPSGAIVATGSSSIRRWHDRIKSDLNGLSIIPRGFGGSQMSDLIYYAEKVILKYHPRAVIIYEGDNDTSHGKSPERVIFELEFLVNYCRTALPELRFYVLSVKPSIARWSIWPTAVVTNNLIKAYCEKTSGVIYIDLATPLLNPEGNYPLTDIFANDGLHLNSKGYDLWTNAIRPVLIEKELEFESTFDTDPEELSDRLQI